MMSLALARARARARLQKVRSDAESGFALIYVMAITTMVALLVGTTLVVTTGAIVPGVQAAYSQAADSAAQAGLQAFVAYADDACPGVNAAVSECTLPRNISWDDASQDVWVTIPSPGADSAYKVTYSWQAQKDPTNRYFRVKSIGRVKEGGLSSTKVVVGDVVGGASLNALDYGVITAFETESSATVLSDWPERTIALDATALDWADVPIKGGQIHWSGASPGTSPGKAAVCNATFDAKGGRSNNAPPNAPNPYVDWVESGENGNNYDHYAPCHTSWGTGTMLLAPANASDGAGGYPTQDALLLSNSYPGGTGPLFDQKVVTNWQYTSVDAGICGTAPGQNYRSFSLLCAGFPVEVGGSPSPSSAYPNIEWQREVAKPPSGTPTIPDNACVYSGPTRVKLSGDGAVITSPQTTSAWVAANASSRPAQCYTGAGASGMAEQTIDLTGIAVLQVANQGDPPKTTPATAHGSSGWPTTGQKLGDTPGTNNSVFWLTNGTSGTSTSVAYVDTATPGTYTPATGDNPSTHSDGAWVPQWTSYNTGSSCNASTALTDLKFANCYLPKDSYGDAYSWLKASVQSAIAANPSSYTTSAAIQTLVNSLVSQGNSSDAANNAPSKADYTSHRWKVTMSSGNANGCTPLPGVAGTATDTTLTAPSSDALYDNVDGKIHAAPSTDTSCYTASVALQIGTCNVALVLGACVNIGNYVWGNGTAVLGGGQSVAQFQVTVKVKKTTTTTTTTEARSSFPSMSDVTQYQMGFDNTGNAHDSRNTFGANGPGDLYVEGSISHTMALVADNDLILTGATGPTGTNPADPSATDPNPDTSPSTATAALELVGRANVRVYHPVKCKITDSGAINDTDAGFCPDDITGLYTSVLPSGAWPYQQYVNMRPDLAGITIHAAMFALGNADAHITCPQPPEGGGVCDGEFTVDNYLRGEPLGYVTEIGTLSMAHHSPVGQEWEIADTSGQTGRHYSGYQMAQQYQNVKSLLVDVNVLHTTSTTSALWHIMSVSTGTP